MTKKNMKLLVVSPHFPPVNAADMHRIRTSLAYYKEYGWDPVVLTVLPEYVEGVHEDMLDKSIPQDSEVYKVPAIPAKLLKLIGISNLGLRSFPYLYSKGSSLIQSLDIKMVFFSTTMFYTFLLGKMWKKKFNVPYVVDIQDPWYSEINYKENFNNKTKYQLNRYILKKLEQWTVRDVDGFISVSKKYIEELQSRYPAISVKPSKTITFGATETDNKIAKEGILSNDYFNPNDDSIHGIYIGRGGNDMSSAIKIICGALRKGFNKNEKLFRKLKLFFIGTSYSSAIENKIFEHIAEEFGVSEIVFEYPERIPYFEALKLMDDSDFIIVPGSNDEKYSASKIYPCILSKKPLICIFHKDSAVVDIVNKTNSGSVVTFGDCDNLNSSTNNLTRELESIMKKIPFEPETNWTNFEKYTARRITEQQCILFNDISADFRY